jgi:hypothetical protein
VVLVPALAIGANASIFSILNIRLTVEAPGQRKGKILRGI